MKFFIKKRYILLIIILIAFILRFYQLGQNPPSLTWDETAWGYNAYSLGLDGKDEFGRFLPHDYLESFGDFKPPVYAYLDILPVKLFGLTEFAVRFPSALFGVLTVLITYFLVRKIFSKSKQFLIFNFQFSIAEIAAAILAISPWHINLSRAAFEANIATFFLVAGVWLFIEWTEDLNRRKKLYLILSVVSFTLSLYTFNTARVVVPILVLGLAIGFRKVILQNKREIITACIIGFLLLLPTLKFLLSPQANLRFREVNIFTDINVIKTTNQQIENDKNVFWSKIIHNRRFAYGVEYIKHYFDNFTPNFLFIKGDGNPKFSTQDIGQLYLWELPFLIIGALILFKKREKNWWIIPLWMAVGVIPAATARETPHALRIEAVLPTFQILVALGLLYIFEILSNFRFKYLIVVLFFLFSFFNVLYYLHGYYTSYLYEYSGEWQYGYKESIRYVEEVKNEYDQINITNVLGRPYVYYLFYTKTNPKDFIKTAEIKRDTFGFVTVEGFDKYRFGEKLDKIDNHNKKILYVNSSGQVPSNAKILKVFRLLNDQPVLTAYTL